MNTNNNSSLRIEPYESSLGIKKDDNSGIKTYFFINDQNEDIDIVSYPIKSKV